MEQPTFRDTFRYATFVWLTAAVGGPFLYIIIDTAFEDRTTGTAQFIGFAIVFGGIFSVPCWLFLMLATHFIHKLSLGNQAKKAILFAIATILTYTPFLFFFGGDTSMLGGYSLMLSYWCAITFGIFYYRLVRVREPLLPLDGPLDQL